MADVKETETYQNVQELRDDLFEGLVLLQAGKITVAELNAKARKAGNALAAVTAAIKTAKTEKIASQIAGIAPVLTEQAAGQKPAG